MTHLTATRLLALCLALGAAQLADAATHQSRLAQARKEYMSQEYERVVRLMAPLVESPTATISDKVEGYELLGLSYLILGEKKRAREAFENLLELESSHVLRDPSDSPKLREFFEDVKRSFVPGYKMRPQVSLEASAPSGATAGRRVELGAVIAKGSREVRHVLLRWRRSGLLTYESVAMQRQGTRVLAGFVLPEDAAGYRLEYYIEARDDGGQVLGRTGDPQRPLTLPVAGGVRRPDSILRAWWFWTVVGAAVVSGVTAGIVVGTSTKVPQGNLPPKIVELR
jgi:hypothetical protein